MIGPRSQAGRVLVHLRAGHTLTQMQALTLFGCMRLGARILDLRMAGHKIHTAWEHSADGSKRWARYSMQKDAGSELIKGKQDQGD
jgi:hypothetical protein